MYESLVCLKLIFAELAISPVFILSSLLSIDNGYRCYKKIWHYNKIMVECYSWYVIIIIERDKHYTINSDQASHYYWRIRIKKKILWNIIFSFVLI